MGGRRKSSKIPKKEKIQTIRTIFDCALCGYKNCVIVKIKKVIKQAELNCEKCNERFSTKIKGLDEAIDVFHQWLNELKKKNLTKGRTENHFQDDSSGEEGSQRNVEEILKQQDDDKKSQFSSDSLEVDDDQQQQKVNKQVSENNSLDGDEDDLSEIISDDLDLNASLISENDDDDEVVEKVRKLKKK